MALIKRTHQNPIAYVDLSEDAVVARFGGVVEFIDAVAAYHKCSAEEAAQLVDTTRGPYLSEHPRVVLTTDTTWGGIQRSIAQMEDVAKAIEVVLGEAHATNSVLTNLCASLSAIERIEGDWGLADMPNDDGAAWAGWDELGDFERAQLVLRAPGAWTTKVFELTGKDIRQASATATLKAARAAVAETSPAA